MKKIFLLSAAILTFGLFGIKAEANTPVNTYSLIWKVATGIYGLPDSSYKFAIPEICDENGANCIDITSIFNSLSDFTGILTDTKYCTYNLSGGVIDCNSEGGGAEVNDLTASVTWDTVPDDYISESSILQHEGAIDHANILNIGTNTHGQIDTHISATEAHGATGAIMGTTNTQTVTNKTFDDYSNFIHSDAVHHRIKCVEAGGIEKGEAVAFSGWNDGEDALEVVLADNSSGVAIGLSDETLANGEFGMLLSAGVLNNIDTTKYQKGAGYASAGDILFVDGDGSLTGNEPSTGFAQPIALILRSHENNGDLQVLAAYPKQDAADVRFTPAGGIVATDVQAALEELDSEAFTPTDIDTDYGNETVTSTWGFSSNLSVASDYNFTVDTNSFFVDGTNNRVGIGTVSPSTKLEVNGVITATGGDSDEWNASYDALIDVDALGFTDRTESTLSFNDSTYTLTLTDAGAGWSYYRGGVKTAISGNKTSVVSGSPPSTATYFFYIDDNSGTITNSTTPWTLLDDKAPVSAILWNNSLTPKYWLMDERHEVVMDKSMQYYLHSTSGAVLSSPPSLSGYTLSSDTDAGKTFGISAATLLDQDYEHEISLLTDPNGTSTDYVSFYRTASDAWSWEATAMPFRYTAAGYIQYDNAGTMTQGQANKYYNSYLIVSNIEGAARFIVVNGRGEFDNLPAAQSEIIEDFTWDGFEIEESVIAYRLTYETKNSYSSKGKCTLAAEPQQINIGTSYNPGSGAGIDHNTLSGLQGGTTNEYYHLDATKYGIANAATASFTTAQETKLGYITVTQAVDLDTMESDIAALANGMVYKGNWDASSGSFPGSGSAQTGWFYTVSVGGTVDSVTFVADDRLISITDNASTSTYAANWSKLDATDSVTSVAGRTGNVTLTESDLTDLGTNTLLNSSNEVITGDYDFGGGGIEIENNTSIPGSCTVGQIFLDTDGTSGQQLYACEGGSFVKQGDGGASDINSLSDAQTTASTVFLGASTGTASGGYYNTATGVGALEDHYTGNYNVADGYYALAEKTSTTGNVGIGALAGRYTNALASNITPSNSVFVGYNSKSLTNNNTNQIVIGALAEGAGSNTTTIGTSSTTEAHVEGSLFLTERASAPADDAGKGQMWVKNDTPNTLWFTDDGGTDYAVSGSWLSSILGDTTPQLGGSLDVNSNKIVSTSNGDIDIEPNGTGNVLLGNFTFDADQTVGSGQDNYIMTYDNGTGKVSLEAAPSGGATSIDGLSDAVANTTSVFLGSGSGVLDDGTSNANSSVGVDSLPAVTTGTGNSAIGYRALNKDNTGGYNTAIGRQSLYSNTSGDLNSAIGNDSMYFNTVGGYNVSIGSSSLHSNVSGSYSVSIGYQSQYYANSTATPWENRNVSVGEYSLRGSTTSSNNTGNDNVSIGSYTMYSNTSGSHSSSLGNYSLNFITTGGHNTAIGYGSGRYYGSGTSSNQTSTYSTYLGYDTRAGANGNTNETVIGNGAIGSGSNTVTLGNTSITGNYLRGFITSTERSSDPSDPAEGAWVIWMSDGTGAGDDGDIMVKITAGATTKTATLLDFSAL